MGLDCANHSEWFFTILLVEDPGLYKKVVKEDRKGRHAAFSVAPASGSCPDLSKQWVITWTCKPVRPSHSCLAFGQSFIIAAEKRLEHYFISHSYFNISKLTHLFLLHCLYTAVNFIY